MPCQWSPSSACQFIDHTNAMIDFEGRDYCSFHLPLDSERKEDSAVFVNRFRALVTAHVTDLRGVVFPGTLGPAPTARYDVYEDSNLQGCIYGPEVTLCVNNCHVDAANSTFTGAIDFLVNASSITCPNSTFLGDATFNVISTSGELDLSFSTFRAACRVAQIDGLRRLDFAGCTFAAAPTFGAKEIPQRTSFRDARFTPCAEDESAYRVIRNFFAVHRARDAEGRFYALEKRCHRLSMTSPREWLPRAVSLAYDLTSEYGYSYGRALISFGIVQAAFCILYAALSGRLDNIGGRYDNRVVAFTFAQVVKPFDLFSSKASFDGFYSIVPENGTGWWLLLTAVQSVLSIATVALFLLALRWRFRRE